MIFMRLFYEAWLPCAEIQHLASVEFHYLPSNELCEGENRQMPSDEIRPLPTGELDKEEVFIDLLFYHRSLRAMVAVELKMGKFRAAYLG